MYSFKISFCSVPLISSGLIPCLLAEAIYMHSKMAAVELMVIDVLTLSKGISLNKMSMSATLQIGTPTLPTSP